MKSWTPRFCRPYRSGPDLGGIELSSAVPPSRVLELGEAELDPRRGG
jgi:hypothetical protein